MDRKKKIGVAVLIVVVGLVIALQFRKSADSIAPSNPESTASQSTAAASGFAGVVDAPNQSISKSAAQFADGVQSLTGQVGLNGSQLGTSQVGPNPSIAAHNSAESEHPLVELNQPDKLHKIVDGDTLAKLAQRYWGHADRFADLYAYNRDVLNDPDVLPIGAELRIPAHPVVAIDSSTETTQPVLPLAPLPQSAPASGPAVPAAATSAPTSQRTYKVQPGDSLIDIARKLYGDGRKHTAIFEANRRVMRNPYDLRPGMLLVVP